MMQFALVFVLLLVLLLGSLPRRGFAARESAT